MAKQIGAKCRLCRRAGVKLFLKGERCFTSKCAVVKRNYPPGAQGAKNAKPRLTGFGMQLREKQKARRFYGISEKQFSTYFEKANSKEGNTGANMIHMLEMRLDNVIYRLGWADSHAQARQFASHGCFTVNGQKVTIPSYRVRPGDIVVLREKHQNDVYFKNKEASLEKIQAPAWLAREQSLYAAKVVVAPTIEEAAPLFDLKSIIEFYSR